MPRATTTKLMQLPRFPGFGKQAFAEPNLSRVDEDAMTVILGNTRYQKGNHAARGYANLIVLFRMLLFYGDIKHHPRFWQWIAEDWGITKAKDSPEIVRSIVKLFSDARYASLQNASEKRLSLLVRLVDEWLLIRPREQMQYLEEVQGSAIAMARTSWVLIRDRHVDMLMDSKHPGCLRDVEVPSKIVTSLWEQDPEVAALLKELNLTKKSKVTPAKRRSATPPSKIKTSPTKSPRSNKSPRQSRFQQILQARLATKRSASSYNGDVWNNEVSPKRQRIVLEDDTAQSTFSRHLPLSSANKTGPPKNSYAVVSDNNNLYSSASAHSSSNFELRSPSPAKPSPENNSRPAAAGFSQQPPPQPYKPTPPSLIQSSLLRFSTIRPNSMTKVQSELRTQLRKVSDQMGRGRREIDARVNVEMTGYVPAVTSYNLADSGLPQQQQPTNCEDRGMAAQEREMYETMLKDIESRVEELERTHEVESKWARAMGRFLYEANQKSLASLQDVFAAVETLQRTSSALLDGSVGRSAEGEHS